MRPVASAPRGGRLLLVLRSKTADTIGGFMDSKLATRNFPTPSPLSKFFIRYSTFSSAPRGGRESAE